MADYSYSERFSYSNQESYKFEPRHKQNNTHTNTVDDKIESIIPYVKLNTRYYIVVVLYFVTLGILFVFTIFFPTLILTLYCKKILGTTKEEIDYVEIIDVDQTHYVCKVIKNKIFGPHQKLEKLIKEDKIQLSKDPNSREEISFWFKNVKYDIVGNTVKPAFLSLKGRVNEEIFREYSTIPETRNMDHLNEWLNRYGPNETIVESMSMTFLVIKQFLNIFHLYCIFCAILWLIISQYFLYALIIIILNALAIIFCISHEYDLAQKISNISSTNTKTEDNVAKDNSNEENEVARDNNALRPYTNFLWDNEYLPNEIIDDPTFLVPGEIVKLGGDYTLTFDGIILEGFCTVDESELTGETNEVYKKALPNNGEYLDYRDRTHFLFQGTQIKQVASDKKKEKHKHGMDDSKSNANDFKSSKSKSKINQELTPNFEMEDIEKSFEYEIKINNNNNNDPAKNQENEESKDNLGNNRHNPQNEGGENARPKDYLKVLVLNTGMNTERANLLLKLSFSKKENHSFNCDLLGFSIIMIIFWITILILNTKQSLGHFGNLLELVSVFIPPALFVSITFSSYCVKKSLKKENIDCVDINKITVAGKANVIILDKTGTLTEDQFELYGYQFTYPDTKFSGGDDHCEQEIKLSELEKSSKILNKIHQKYWKEYNDFHYQYKDDLRFNIVYFTECLGSCHGIDTFEDKNLGDALDKKIFESIKWMIQIETDENGLERRCVMPKNLYKISEKAVFNKFSGRKFDGKSLFDDISITSNLTADPKKMNGNLLGENAKIFDQEYLLTDAKSKDKDTKKSSSKGKKEDIKSYKLIVEKIYGFSSETQSTTVFTYNTIDKTRRIYKKGAPEGILENCLKDTQPNDINEQIMKLAEGGLRVLAFSTRVVECLNTYKCMNKEQITELERLGKEPGMVFLGLVAFKNPLKKDTQSTIKKLYDAKFQLTISTGDNEYTSFYVAKQSNMINSINKVRYVLDINNNEFILTENSNIREEVDFFSRRRKKKKVEENYDASKTVYENIRILSNSNKKFTLSCSGKALSKIIEFKSKPARTAEENKNRNDLCSFLKKYGVIFFRMSPEEKASLVSFFREDNKSVVIMCGDGSNDIQAILEADIGITLNQQKNLKILSHFSMNNSSIRCIEIIVRFGRGCFENNEVTFKFLITYGALQLVSFFLLNYTRLPLFSLYQRFYIDCFCSLIPNLLGNLTSPSMVLADETIGTSLMNMKMIISTLLQLIIQIGFLVGYYKYVINNVYYKNEYDEIITYSFDDFLCKGTISVAGTYIFLYISFQLLISNITFNLFALHRNHVSTNSIYLIVVFSIFFLYEGLVCIAEAKDYGPFKNLLALETNIAEFEFYLEFNRVMIQVFVIGDAMVSIFVEFLVSRYIKNY